MRGDWLEHVEEARTAEVRMARIEEWVDLRHVDLGLDYEAPRYQPPWQRIIWGAIHCDRLGGDHRRHRLRRLARPAVSLLTVNASVWVTTAGPEARC